MISAHMFQQGPAINVNKDTTSKSINANPMGTISYAIDINLKLVTNNTKPIWARSKLLCFNKDQLYNLQLYNKIYNYKRYST